MSYTGLAVGGPLDGEMIQSHDRYGVPVCHGSRLLARKDAGVVGFHPNSAEMRITTYVPVEVRMHSASTTIFVPDKEEKDPGEVLKRLISGYRVVNTEPGE